MDVADVAALVVLGSAVVLSLAAGAGYCMQLQLPARVLDSGVPAAMVKLLLPVMSVAAPLCLQVVRSTLRVLCIVLTDGTLKSSARVSLEIVPFLLSIVLLPLVSVAWSRYRARTAAAAVPPA